MSSSPSQSKSAVPDSPAELSSGCNKYLSSVSCLIYGRSLLPFNWGPDQTTNTADADNHLHCCSCVIFLPPSLSQLLITFSVNTKKYFNRRLFGPPFGHFKWPQTVKNRWLILSPLCDLHPLPFSQMSSVGLQNSTLIPLSTKRPFKRQSMTAQKVHKRTMATSRLNGASLEFHLMTSVGNELR